MKTFKIQTAGYEVTNENFVEVAKQISNKYGVCPALNNIVMAVATHIDGVELTKKGLNKACKQAIKMIGYTPKYFDSKMREIGSEYFGDED